MLGAKIAHFAIEPGNNMLDTQANKNIKTKGKDARRGRAGGEYGKEISGI